MKITHLLLGCILLFSVNQNYGQIKINSSGNIGTGTWSPNNSYTITGSSAYFGSFYSAYDRTSYSYVYESAGIGTSYNSEYTLVINPNSSVQNVLYISDGNNNSSGHSLYVNGDALSTGGWYTSSDRKLKKKERRILRNNILSKLTKVRGKRYEYKSKEELLTMHNSGEAHFPVDTIYKTKKIVNEEGKVIHVPTSEIKEIVVDVPKYKSGERYGVVAQDVLLEYPELVFMDESTGMYAVDYQGFIPLLLEGFNLQEERMLEMMKEIKTLKKKVKKLNKK